MFTVLSKRGLQERWRGAWLIGGRLWMCVLQQEHLWDLGAQPYRDAPALRLGEKEALAVGS